MMEYKGYVGKINYDEKEDIFFGEVINIKDTITFYGSSVKSLHREMAESIDFYLETCNKKGLEPSKPFAGKLSVPLTPEIHGRIVIAAKKSGKTLNKWVAETLLNAAT